MDQNPQKRRWRFGLRTLFVLVAGCAVTTQMMRPEEQSRDDLTAQMFVHLKSGMTKSQVRAMFGPPHRHHEIATRDMSSKVEVWTYLPGTYLKYLREAGDVMITSEPEAIPILFVDGKVK